MCVLFRYENLRAPGFKSSQVFWHTHTPAHRYYTIITYITASCPPPTFTKRDWLTEIRTCISYYTLRNDVRGGGGGGGGYIGFTLSVSLSVCPSVCPLTFRVRPVASTVQDGFFPYLVQMINSMRGCVACDDLWPWPISSRSFGLDLENRVRSVASIVLDGFFLYLAQMITIIRGGCRVLRFFQNLEIWLFSKFF